MADFRKYHFGYFKVKKYIYIFQFESPDKNMTLFFTQKSVAWIILTLKWRPPSNLTSRWTTTVNKRRLFVSISNISKSMKLWTETFTNYWMKNQSYITLTWIRVHIDCTWLETQNGGVPGFKSESRWRTISLTFEVSLNFSHHG